MAKSIKETLRLALRYDPATGKIYWRDDWYPASRTTDEVGWIEHPEYPSGGYLRFHHRGQMFMGHRVIWFLHYGEWPPQEIDHIDGDSTNNRIENLRLSDRTQNNQNKRPYKNNKTGYKGVSITKKGNYLSQIAKDKKNYWLGEYNCPIEAARAYDRKAIDLHGQYAKTNFPIEDYLGA
jgi:hypothetical protein